MSSLKKATDPSNNALKTGNVILTKLESNILCTLSARISGLERRFFIFSIFDESRSISCEPTSSANLDRVELGEVSEIMRRCNDRRKRLVKSSNSVSYLSLYLLYCLYPLSLNMACLSISFPALVLIKAPLENTKSSLLLIYNEWSSNCHYLLTFIFR